MSNTEVEKLLESIVSTRQFEQWRSEMLFYISESGFINEQRKHVIQHMESNESIEPIFESNKDSPLIKKILVEMVLDNLMNSGIKNDIDEAVLKAMDSQSTFWKDSIRDYVENSIKNQKSTSNTFQKSHSNHYEERYNRDSYKGKRWY